MADLKREAARQGRTMSELVESALRLLLRSQRKRKKIVALPTFHSGGALVDIADRRAASSHGRPYRFQSIHVSGRDRSTSILAISRRLLVSAGIGSPLSIHFCQIPHGLQGIKTLRSWQRSRANRAPHFAATGGHTLSVAVA